MSNESLEYELQHLINLAAPPFRECWAAYIWVKAKGLAEHDPATYGDLPRRLKEAMTQE